MNANGCSCPERLPARRVARLFTGSPIDWQRQPIDARFGGGHGLQAADIDGDGASYEGMTSWWRNSGEWPVSCFRQRIATIPGVRWTGAILLLGVRAGT